MGFRSSWHKHPTLLLTYTQLDILKTLYTHGGSGTTAQLSLWTGRRIQGVGVRNLVDEGLVTESAVTKQRKAVVLWTLTEAGTAMAVRYMELENDKTL